MRRLLQTYRFNSDLLLRPGEILYANVEAGTIQTAQSRSNHTGKADSCDVETEEHMEKHRAHHTAEHRRVHPRDSSAVHF
jgi:hypothetical protein